MSKQPRNVLDWLHKRRGKSGIAMISDEEFQAGDRLRQDYFYGRMAQRVTTVWSPVLQGRSRRSGQRDALDFHDRTLAAQERVRRALAAMLPEHASILVDVCCLDGGLRDVERRHGWPQRSAKIVLQMALRQLARHYGLLRETAHGDTRPASVRHWGGEGYRPDVDWHSDAENLD